MSKRNGWPSEESTMKTCAQCGNDYDKAFDVIADGRSYTFDSFECAIQKLAPVCGHCGCRIIGHGMETDGKSYCCAHCAGKAGAKSMRDRADKACTFVSTPNAEAQRTQRTQRKTNGIFVAL